jgi:hypothetical protein
MGSPRKIGYIEKFQDLKPGDILLFRPSNTVFSSQNTVMFFQKLLSLEHGHYDTTHVAICVAMEDGQPVIAHSYETISKGKIWRGYIRQPLQQMLKDEDGLIEGNYERPFLVFRPRDPKAAEVTAKFAGDEKANRHIQWTYAKAIRTYFRPAFWRLDEDRPMKCNKTIPDEAICSQFVISMIKLAEQKRYKEGDKLVNRLTIRSSSTPKALEACLYRDKNHYDLLCYPGKNAYWILMSAIRMQLSRIKKRSDGDDLPRQKYLDGIKQYNNIRKKHKKNESALNHLDKSIELLRIMMPILNRHTGFSFFGLWNTTSYNLIRDKARKMGIFEREYVPPKAMI